MTEELWELYKKTCFFYPQQRVINLHTNDTQFAIISARNPMGQQQSEQRNLDAENNMKQWLEKEKIAYKRIYGCSPALDYIEPSFQLNLPDKAQAIAISRCFQQKALFWIEDGRLWLVSCDDKVYRAAGLGLFVERLIETKASQFDWLMGQK